MTEDRPMESEEEFEAGLTDKVLQLRKRRRCNGGTRQDDGIEKELLRANRKSKKSAKRAKLKIDTITGELCAAFDIFVKNRAKKDSA